MTTGIQIIRNVLGSLVFIIAAWYLALTLWPNFVFVLPWPHKVGKALLYLPTDGAFRSDFIATLLRTLSGFLIGNALAAPVGILMSRYALIKTLFTFPLDFFRSLPAVVLLPILFAFVNPNGPIHIVLITISVFLVMALSFSYGLDRGSTLRRNVARKLGLNKIKVFFQVELREALPEIVTGWKISISIALILATVAEMFFPSKGGLGAYISLSSQNVNKEPEEWASIVVLGSLGFFLNGFFTWLNSKYCFWKGR